MKSFLLSSAFLLICLATTQAKTTYIPTYRSYIHIVTDGDTVSTSGNLTWTEMKDGGGMFEIGIEHEEVTREKVKAIKRAKAAAGWAAFATVLSGVSTALSDNSLQYYVRSENTRLTAELADMYAFNANEEQTLGVSVWLHNTSGHELMVNDMERGLTWFIMAGELRDFKLHNPDAACLRISDTKNDNVRYMMATGGSIVRKYIIGWEDDDCWITENYTGDKFPTLVDYTYIIKRDYSRQKMSTSEFNEWKKSHNIN